MTTGRQETMAVTEVHVQLGDADRALTVDLPEGWTPRPFEGGEIAIAPQAVADRFTPNLVVGLSEIPPELGLDGEIAALQTVRDSLDDVHVLGEGTFVVAGRAWFVTEFVSRDPRAGTIVQSVRLAQLHDDPDRDVVVRLTATAGGETAEEDLRVLRGAMNSVNV